MANTTYCQNMHKCHRLVNKLIAQVKTVLDVFPKLVEFPSSHVMKRAEPKFWSFVIREQWFLATMSTSEKASIPLLHFCTTQHCRQLFAILVDKKNQNSCEQKIRLHEHGCFEKWIICFAANWKWTTLKKLPSPQNHSGLFYKTTEWNWKCIMHIHVNAVPSQNAAATLPAPMHVTDSQVQNKNKPAT